MMENLIKGHVAGVLNERELIINVGSDDGVTLGMKFKILSDSSIIVKDPITDEEIGEIDREKIRVKCIEVQEKLSVCTTYRVITQRNVFSGSAIMKDLFEDKEYVETLRYNPNDKPEPLSMEESYVKVRDRCIQIKDDD